LAVWNRRGIPKPHGDTAGRLSKETIVEFVSQEWGRVRELPGQLQAAFVVALIPFVLSLSSTTEAVTADGVRCDHIDYAALFGGGIALLGAASTLVSTHERTRFLISAVAVVAMIGVFQLTRGLGVVMGPCN
jgi:peptidoglycan/LPS O-acetylase OafA/YrhL